MPFPSGSRLGPYEVLSPLGAGGMGEVYRARDPRLGRDVAIKVLPADLASDAGRLKRFEKEARSASALNHPNIVTIYEIGSADSISYIAMELVEGKTVRELLFAGPLPVKRTLQLASQVADGLARAHEAGIVHRDLKPENLMVTKDGRVKILDFGLAKLTPGVSESGEGTNLPTETGTGAGVILGTVGYMSPEQAAGQPVDFRSDQFSFGSILYEMTTGKRAFQRKTGVETLSAIISEEPKPIGAFNPDVPAPLRWIVGRCLAKDPEDRYASTKDLCRELRTISDHLSETFPSPAAAAGVPLRRASFRVGAIAAGLALLAALLIGVLAGRPVWRSSSPPPATIRRLTFRDAGIQTARFAPDGHTIVYTISTSRNAAEDELVSTRIGSPESRSFNLKSALLQSVSGSGEMAILFGNRPERTLGTLATVSLAGGAPRSIVENVASADWAPGSQQLAVVRVVDNKYRLEFPVGKVLYEASAPLRRLRFSRGGDRIAFREGGNLNVVDRSGNKKTLGPAFGFVWSPRGDEIWFNDVAAGVTTFQAVTLSGRKRFMTSFPGDFALHDVAPGGGLLLERASEENEIVGRIAGESEERNLSWLDGSLPADLSADGKTLLFTERKEGGGANGAVYKRQTDGSDAVRLGEGSAIALSPDGTWALCSTETDGLVLIPTGAGTPRPLPLTGIEPHGTGGFFPDGRRIVVLGSEAGHRPRLYALDIESLQTTPITPEGIPQESGVMISPDGKLIVCSKPDGKSDLYDVQGGPARSVPSVSKDLYPIEWCADSRCLFVRTASDSPVKVYRLDLSSGRLELWREFSVSHLRSGLSLMGVLPTPDGKSYVYGYSRYFSDLYLAEGLR